MKNFNFLIILVSMLFISAPAFSQTPEPTPRFQSRMGGARNPNNIAENNIKISLGLDQGAINLGAEYESRSGANGLSGYFLLATEKITTGKPQIMTFGGGMPIYFYDNKTNSLFITPGLGLNMIKVGNTTEMTFGPQIKLGTGYRLSPNLRLGLEHFIITNALNEKAGGSQHFTNFLISFTL